MKEEFGERKPRAHQCHNFVDDYNIMYYIYLYTYIFFIRGHRNEALAAARGLERGLSSNLISGFLLVRPLLYVSTAPDVKTLIRSMSTAASAFSRPRPMPQRLEEASLPPQVGTRLGPLLQTGAGEATFWNARTWQQC